MNFKMLIKSIERREEDLRQRNKNLETEEGSCLMETWKRRGEPEEKGSHRNQGRKIFQQRGKQTAMLEKTGR